MKVSCHFQGRHSLIEMENIWYTWIYRYVGNMCMCEVLKWQIMTDQWKYKQNPPTHSFICWLTHSFIRWLTDSHSLTHIHSLTQSLTHPPNHLPTTHSLTHSLTKQTTFPSSHSISYFTHSHTSPIQFHTSIYYFSKYVTEIGKLYQYNSVVPPKYFVFPQNPVYTYGV